MSSSTNEQKESATNDTEEKDGESDIRRRTPITAPTLEDDGNGSDSHDEYTDYSSSATSQPASDLQRSTESGVPIRYRKFPAKLDAMLSSPDFEPYIAWMPHGRSWKILDTKAFTKCVLPFFNSFIRLVNAWGFRRKISSGLDRNSYYHEFFLRGKPHLQDRMSRLGPNKKKPIGTEPDLFSLPPLPPLPPPTPTTRRQPISGPFSLSTGLPSQSAGEFAAGALLTTSPSTTPTASTTTDSTPPPPLPQVSTTNTGNTPLWQQENTFTTGSISSLGNVSNIQQILGLLQPTIVSSASASSIGSLTRHHGWTAQPASLPTSGSTASTNIELNALLSRVQQHQSAASRMLPNPTQHQASSLLNQNRDAPSSPAHATNLFIEQAARELALRQIQQESSSEQLLLASLLNQHPQNSLHLPAASSPLLQGGNAQLPSRLDGPFLMELNSRVASDSSMVPNYLRSWIASDISAVRRSQEVQLPAVTRPVNTEPGDRVGLREGLDNKSSSDSSDASNTGERKNPTSC